MQFKVTITTDNAAFHEDSNGVEIARILRRLAADIDNLIIDEDTTIPIRDINGNTVGEATHD